MNIAIDEKAGRLVLCQISGLIKLSACRIFPDGKKSTTHQTLNW
jgi:hypothetical protein